MSKIQRIIATGFLVVGVVLLVIGAYMAVVPAIPKEYAATTQATIIDISTSYGNTTTNGRRNERHDVPVEYQVDGKSYQGQLGYYTTGMVTGQQVEIQYDTRNPSAISSPTGRTFGMIILLALGSVFIVLGVVLMVKPVPVFINGRKVA